MHSLRSLKLLSIAIAGCAASNASGPQRDGSPVQTDSVVYRLRRNQGAYEATAHATYVNRTGGTIYYVRCLPSDDFPIFGYFRVGPDSTRRLFTDTGWGCVGNVPVGVIRSGESLAVDVRLGALPQPQMRPPLRPEEIVGRMRIWFALAHCASPTAPVEQCVSLPMTERQSNAFDVRF